MAKSKVTYPGLSEFTKMVTSGVFPPVLLLAGGSPAALRSGVQSILCAVAPGQDASLNSETMDGRETTPSHWLSRVRTVPMFGARRVVVVTEAEHWLGGNKDQKDEDEENEEEAGSKTTRTSKLRQEELNSLLPHLQSTGKKGLLILLSSRVDGRLKLVAELGRLNALFLLDPMAGSSSVGDFIRGKFARNKVRIDTEAVAFLVEVLGASSEAIETEVDKLVSHAGNGGRVTLADAELLVQRLQGHKYYELADALIDRDGERALRILSRMFDFLIDAPNKVSSSGLPLLLLAVILGKFEQLAALSSAPTEQQEAILRRFGVSPKAMPYVMRDMRRRLSTFSVDELEQVLTRIHEVDARLKSTSLSPKLLLEDLVVGICAKSPRRRGNAFQS